MAFEVYVGYEKLRLRTTAVSPENTRKDLRTTKYCYLVSVAPRGKDGLHPTLTVKLLNV
jgi:hypothetical protein